MDNVELAHDGLEHAKHGHGEGLDPWGLRSAMLIAALAAMAVVGEMSANDAQTEYLAAHISASDTWTQYQAKSVRRTVYLQTAQVLTATHAGPARLAAAEADASRMQSEPGKDGMEQLALRAKEFEHERDHALHLYSGLERGVRGLQIGVVLTSLFIATRKRWLLIGGATLGIFSALYALCVSFGIF